MNRRLTSQGRHFAGPFGKDIPLTLRPFTITFCLMIACVSAALAQGPRQAQWKEVDTAMEQGLPQTALAKLLPIIEQSLRDRAYPEAIKAISLKVALEGDIQGDRAAEKIERMQVEIANAPAEMRPVMESILANWYWHYYQQNRWQFMQRTQTAAAPGEDFTTWDLTRILREIDKRFQESLASSQRLKEIPITDYDELLEKGTAADAYRPTLYDFLAYEAIEFYSAAEQAGAQAEDRFELGADSPIVAPVADFVAWEAAATEPAATDPNSATLKAIGLYQSLLRFHQADADRSAFLDADLARLRFGNNLAVGEEKSARYKAALNRFADANADHALSSLALEDLASAVHQQEDYREAHQLASRGLARFPDSLGADRCFNLIQQIEARSSQVHTERVWNQPLPTIDVHYRNVTKIYFRLVPLDFEAYIASSRWQPEQMDDAQRRKLLAQRPINSWSANLPATADYQERVEPLAAPADIKPGSYYLIASHNEQFSEDDNQLSISEIWISDLALVIRSGEGDTVEGLVLDAVSGEPKAGARVRAWRRGGNRRDDSIPPTTTDQNGLFRFTGSASGSLILHAAVDGHALSSTNAVYARGRSHEQQLDERTIFFTDRSLYRPGQTIHYKGICISVDQARDDYNTIAGRKLTVVFNDVNGQEIERVSHRSNDYGSFSGSVTAPRDRLMGQMSLIVNDGPRGQAYVSVEEYKRPKFEVTLAAPTEAPKLSSDVELEGKATAYTGAAVDGATVRWRVVRRVEYPIWWFWRNWWMPPMPDSSQEIAHGTALTRVDGAFDIQFDARPDLSVAVDSEPTFRFTVHADVIDSAGETRSADRSIAIGYTALKATLTADDWQTNSAPIQIHLATTTLDGDGQASEGSLKVYALKQPAKVTRAPLAERGFPPLNRRGGAERTEAPQPDPSNPNSWELGDVVFEETVQADASGQADIEITLPAGAYRAKYETRDRFGKSINAELPLLVIDPDAKRLSLKLPHLVAAAKPALEPGEEFVAVWGSGYDAARAFVEVEHRGKLLQSYWTAPGTNQVAIKQKVSESMRGGFTLRITMVRENRAYLHSQTIDVPWSNKNLSLKWEHFVSKLEPAQKETWTLVISGPDAKQAVAEMVAAMYDASLDAFKPHQWQSGFDVFRRERSSLHSQFENELKSLQILAHGWQVEQRDGEISYRSFPEEIVGALWGLGPFGNHRLLAEGMAMPMAARAEPAEMAGGYGLPRGTTKLAAPMAAPALDDMVADSFLADLEGGEPTAPDSSAADFGQVSARKNLNETAFFFPHLIASEDGTVRIEFTMPEALTQWKFLGFAHDKTLRAGLLSDKVVTAKELMVQPNPPRFLREGDRIEFTAKVSNQSPTRLTGYALLTLMDARSGEPVNDRLEHVDLDLPFDIPAGESTSLSWILSVPDDLGFLTYRVVGATGKLSDGEEGFLPVLSRRILITESMPLPIRGNQTKQFDFSRLTQSAESDTLEHQSLTVQMTSNPSWYAVLALPYLMEYPYECSEQVFNRLYANALARHIAQSDPRIRRVFELWRNEPALESPLEKSQDLKAVMIEETPWLREAKSESQARRNVGVLFDENRLNDETSRLLFKLNAMQLEDGRWPWFPGGPANDYITLYIATGFGRLRHLGANLDTSPAVKSLARLDQWVTELYDGIAKAERDKNQLSATVALYLYGRSFFLDDLPIADPHREAVNYWLTQAKTHWLELASRQSQAHLAVALKRFGDLPKARGIMASIKERSVSDVELGMHWRDVERSWWWYHAPIESQAMMIEAFDEVMNDSSAVEDCKVWLLKQKQTQDWRTTKATADAVYALLLRGSDLLASDAPVEVTLGGQTIESDDVEAGTGFFEHRLMRSEVRPELGQITVKKLDDGVAWGSVHWQYLEDISKVTPHDATPLKLTKQLYTKQTTNRGPELQLIDGAVQVGDELVTRLVLRSDRDMEYVHLKDYRGSGTEPVNVLSRYKYQDGLAYYESTRDTASHFFIDYLPKGTYVFEYSTRVQLRGEYQTGVASIQCMYAPEFNGHSQSVSLEVE